MEVLNEIVHIRETLKRSPIILKGLLKSIHSISYKEVLIPGKWTIHEHVCHLAEAHEMLNGRMKRFLEEDEPDFKPYFPDKEESSIPLIERNMDEMVTKFLSLRTEILAESEKLPGNFWSKQAKHPEYYLYTPLIMFRHMMMHDHLHMYRIEELWLTKSDFLKKK